MNRYGFYEIFCDRFDFSPHNFSCLTGSKSSNGLPILLMFLPLSNIRHFQSHQFSSIFLLYRHSTMYSLPKSFLQKFLCAVEFCLGSSLTARSNSGQEKRPGFKNQPFSFGHLKTAKAVLFCFFLLLLFVLLLSLYKKLLLFIHN